MKKWWYLAGGIALGAALLFGYFKLRPMKETKDKKA